MNQLAKEQCAAAMLNITHGDYLIAIVQLRFALPHVHDRRCWSRLMLAIRELNKLEQANANS